MARKPSRTEGLIKVRCPNPACRKILAVKSEMGGKKARCPLCGQTMAIPKVAAPAQKPPAEEKAAPPPPEHEAPSEGSAAPEEQAPPEKPEEPEPPPAEEKEPPRPEPPAEPPVEEEVAKEPEQPPPPEPEEPAPAGPGPKAQEKPEEKTEAPPPAKDEVFFQAPAPPPAEAPAGEKPSAPAADEPPPEPTRPGAESVMVGAPPQKGHPTPRTLARVAKEAEETGYELLGGTLRVVGAIGYDLNTGFRDKCDQLLASDEKSLFLDLEQVLYLSSSHIGVIARLATEAKSQERSVRVRVTGKVARVLKFAGIDRLVEIENIDA